MIKSLEKKVPFWVIFILGITSFLNSYSQYPKSPEPWQNAYNISIESFSFQHPMTVLNADEVTIIKQRLKHGIEPQATIYNDIVAEAQAALDFVPDPPSTLNIPGGYVDSQGLEYARTLLWENCHPAYTLALAYTFTDKSAYANKAISILMSWANKGTTFTDEDRGLQLGSYFSPMLYAADLLYDYEGWVAADKEKFKNWWKQECLINGDVLDVMRRKDNNWKDAGLLGTFAASVVLEDTAYLRESLIQLKSYFYPRTDEYVRLPGSSWKIAKDENGIYLPREVVRNDGRSGLTYTAYALTTMVQCFEIARYADHNFWNDKTEEGAGIMDVVDQYYRWDVREDVFPWDANANRSDKRRNLYEVTNARYTVPQEIRDFIQLNRPVAGREGDTYSTFNKGDMNGWDTTTLAIPELSIEVLSRDQLKLNWDVSSENYYGIIIMRKQEDSFILLDTINRHSPYYIDKELQANTSYTYKIGVFNASSESVYSVEQMKKTPETPTVAPDAPRKLKASSGGTDRIFLQWDDNSSNEDGFVIERKSTNGYTSIDTTGVNDTTYLDEGLELSTIYTYRVYATNPAGNSGYSNEAKDTTLFVRGIFRENTGVVSIEAEYGDLGTRWEIKPDESLASGGKFIEVNPEFDQTGDLPGCDVPGCNSIYYFELIGAGNYSFWFRTLSGGGEDDSFFWRINGGDWIKENGRAMIGAWYFTNNNQTNNLQAGIHTLEVANREDGTRLDKFIIQLASIEKPSDKGPTASSAYGGWLPYYPTELNITANIIDTITLAWMDNSDDEQGFIIERKSGSDFDSIGETQANVLHYVDLSITENTTYTYRVKSYNQYGSSVYSNAVGVTSEGISFIPPKTKNQYQIRIAPNPSTEFVDIRYSIPSKSDVNISIYNILGKKVETLHAGILKKGNYTTRWNPKLEQSNISLKGTYFCILNIDSKLIIRKVVLI